MGLLNSTVSKKKTYHTWKVTNIVYFFLEKNQFKALVCSKFHHKKQTNKKKKKKNQLELLSCSKHWQFLCLLYRKVAEKGSKKSVTRINLAHFTIILSIVILIMENIN